MHTNMDEEDNSRDFMDNKNNILHGNNHSGNNMESQNNGSSGGMSKAQLRKVINYCAQ